MIRRLRTMGRAALLLAAFSGCSGSELGGSLAEAFDLGYSSVLIRRSAKAVQVSYLRSAGNEVVIRLTVVVEGVDVTRAANVDLSSEYAPGHPRATVSRAVEGEPVRQLPAVVEGELSLDGPPDPGRELSGSFSVRFGENGDLGAGRTLHGRFSETVQGAD